MAGILIIAHAPLASALRDCATHVYGRPVARVIALDVPADADPEKFSKEALTALEQVSSDNGILILTDVFGATPSNIAMRLGQIESLRTRVRVIAGVNLPMLVRAISYRVQNLDTLVQKALVGGTQGILQIGSRGIQNQNNFQERHAASEHHHHQ